MKLGNRNNLVKSLFERIDPKIGISAYEADFLDDIATALGSATWEIGPDIFDPEKWFFSLSGAKTMSEVESFRIHLCKLPMVEGWLFYPALPPKDWNIFFIYQSVLEIDGCAWNYCFTERNEKIDIIMHAPENMKRFDLIEVSKMLIIGEIGEENFLKYIGDISISNIANCKHEFSDFAKMMASNFFDLYYHDIIEAKNRGMVLRPKGNPEGRPRNF